MKERNMLFGLLAVRERKIPVNHLAEVAGQTASAEKDLGSLLVAAGTISEQDRLALEATTDSIIQESGNVHEALKRMNADEESLRTLGESLYGDPSAAETLGIMASQSTQAETVMGASPLDRSNMQTLASAPAEERSHMQTIASVPDADQAEVPTIESVPDADRSNMQTIASVPDADRSHMQTIASVPEGDRSNMQTIASVPPGQRSNMETVASEGSHFGTSTGSTVPMKGRPSNAVTLADLQGGGPSGGSGQAVPAVREHPGRYRSVRTLAQGGMGQIDIVHDKHLGREIALKTLLPGRVQGATLTRTKEGAPTMDLLTVPIIARFLQEAHVTGQLEHPAIIPIYEMGYRDDGTLYYTMRFIKGQSIQDKLKDCKDLKDRLQILTHFLDICQAMAYAHSRGVIHRDLKPMNVMVGEFGETTVIDWGIAKVRGEQDLHAQNMREVVKKMEVGGTQATVQTMYGATMGSPYYMPPEQAAGRTDEINERADIYALGAILYVILAGQPPYHGMNVREFLAKVGDFPPKPVLEIEPNAPKELAAVVAKAMAKDPKDRYQTAGELADEVQNFLSGGLVSAYDYNFSELLRRFYKKHKRVIQTAASLSAALLVVIVAYSAVATYLWRYAEEQRGIAVVNEAEAIKQKGIAEVNEAEAVKQKGIAETNEERAKRELYYAKVGLAAGSIDEHLMAKARLQLATAPAVYRNWEWGRLEQMAHADLMTIRGGGNAVAYGDGYIVAGQDKGGIDVTDDQTGERLHRLIEETGTGYAFDFSAASDRVALLEQTGAHVWDARSGEKIYSYDDPVEPGRIVVRQASLSADGSRYAMLNRDNMVRVVALPGGEELYSAPLRQAAGMAVLLSPDGSLLFTVGQVMSDTGVEVRYEVIRLEDGKSLGSAATEQRFPINAAAFSPDNQYLAIAGEYDGVKVIPLSGADTVFTLGGRYNIENTVAFSADSLHLAAGTRDGDLYALDLATGAKQAVSKAHGDQIRTVKFDEATGRVVTASYDRTAKLWEFRGGTAAGLTPIAELSGHDEALFDAAFSPDGGRLATVSFDRRTKVWDLRNEMELLPASNLAYDPDNALMAGAVGNAVVVWRTSDGHRALTLEGHTGEVGLIAFSPASKRIAAIGGEPGSKELIVWSSETGEETGRAAVADDATQLGLSQSGTRAAVVAKNMVTLYSIDGVEPLEAPIEGNFVLDASHRTIAFAAANTEGDAKTKDLYVVNFNTATPITVRSLGETFAVSLAFDHGGQHIAAGLWLKEGAENDLRVTLVPLQDTAQEVTFTTGHGNGITTLAFSGDDKTLATGSKDNDIRLFNAADGAALTTIQGHADAVQSLAFSPDGSRLASASLDGTFMLWNTDPATTEPEVLMLHNQARTAEGQVVRPDFVQFSEDGTRLATLTSGRALPPYILRTVPWADAPQQAEDQTDEAYEETLLDHMEAYKRAQWQGK